jgi:hypothetical protein
MFNAPRMHRWLTLPAAIALVAGMATSNCLIYFLLIAPPMLALPFIAHAAVRQTPRATGNALIATRFSALILALFGLLAVTESPAGLVWIGAAGLQLLAAGTGRDERRLGAATIVTGLLMGVASWLLMWIGANPHLLLFGAGFLMAGGAVWVTEAHHHPHHDADFPAMAIAA